MKLRIAAAVLLVAILLGVTAGCGGTASREPESPKYPTKPIDLIVAFPPGGSSDMTARLLAERLSKEWGVPINVVNKPGGGGTVGTLDVVQAKPDGYTMLTHSITCTLAAATSTQCPYKWDQMTPVSLVMANALVLTISPDLPYSSVAELLDAIKKDPSKFKAGVGSAGAPAVFGLVKLFDATGIDPKSVEMVVFQGGAPTLAAVAGGHVQLASQNLPEAVSLINAGKLKALAVTTDTRGKSVPNVPTAREAGFPAYDQLGWNGISGPPGLPDYVVKKWAEGIQKVVQDPSFVEKIESMDAVVIYKGPDDFKQFVEQEYKSALAIAERVGIRK
ncbi:MAG: tripartite tricarboxylate transporter substrate binding protein [Bacillota bacterium]|nr:tripartite tricarboxylate transporter substrate binding protein [Bacillota bacterium]